MGSLMGGWDSPVLGDDAKARRMRNRSLIKEEVEAFRRQHGKDGGAGDDITSPLASPRPTSGSPVAHGHEEIDTGDADAAGESRDWWSRSNSAFLNESPREEAPGKAHSYTPQFHVAGGGGRIAT